MDLATRKYSRGYDHLYTAQIVIKPNFKDLVSSHVDCYSVQVAQNLLTKEQVVVFEDTDVLAKFTHHFKNSTGLNPFAFS